MVYMYLLQSYVCASIILIALPSPIALSPALSLHHKCIYSQYIFTGKYKIYLDVLLESS